jgi:hypothetical protein
MQSISRVVLVLTAAVGGCANNTDHRLGDPAELFPIGASREQLYVRRTPGEFIWLKETEPEDRFAAATIYEMVRAGKSRPRAYEVFLTHSADSQARYRDYVFYNDQQRVTYVARRRD